MRISQVVLICLSIVIVIGCSTPRPYEMAEFRTNDMQYSQIALNKDGLSREQIDAIVATKPPKSFPVDIAVIVLTRGYLDVESEDDFTFNVVSELKKSDRIGRITLIPDFLVPGPLDFKAIQELGVRSLSEYVIVFNLNADELFRWTKIIETKFEIYSAVNYVFVDSFTSAMLTADKITSTQEYESKLFALGEQRKARKTLFTEQAAELARQIDMLLGSTR